MTRRHSPPATLGPWASALAASACLLPAPGLAQQAGPTRGVVITPSITVSQTLTDSYRALGATGGDARGSEAITTVSPALRVTSRRGRIQGSVDYTLSGVLHARDSAANDILHRLAAAGRAELVPGHLDFNASASITRQPVSAFGVQTADGALSERNQANLRNVALQPVLRGVLGGEVAMQAALNASWTDGGTDIGSRSTGASLSLSPAAAGRVLTWSLTGGRQVSNYDGGRETTTDRAVASIIVRPDVDLQVTVRGGVERTDLASLERTAYENYGVGILWSPTPRTRVALDGDKRQFGQAHQVSLEHRFRRSVWRYTDNKSLNDGSSTTGRPGTSVTAYDLFFELFASQEPDPVARDLLVRGFLERNGVDPSTPLGSAGFLTSAVSIQRRQELSFAVTASRTSFTAAVYQTRSERGDALSGAADDLVAGPVVQHGLTVSVSHRLTPVSSLTFSAGTQRTRSEVQGRNTLDRVALGWNTRVGRLANLALTVRHVEFDGAIDPYTENAVTAAFSTRF